MFEVLPEIVIAVDPTLNICYVNPFARRMTGLGDGLIGTSMIAILHPDDVLRAAEVASLILDGSLGAEVTPATYRVRRADGTWLEVEVTATPPLQLGDGTERIVIVGRYSGDAELRNRIFTMLTKARPSDEIIDLLPGYGAWRYPNAHYLVSYPTTHSQPDRWRQVGSAVAADLYTRFDDANTPWAHARRGIETQHGWSDLPDDLRFEATQLGLLSCMVLPVPLANSSDFAVALAWSTDPKQSVSAHRYALEQMAESLDLVLQWQGHVEALEQAARFDELSGVANRNMFMQQLEFELRQSTGSDQTIAVLYVDLDRFKTINDQFGHAAGDAVIQHAARLMTGAVREGDVVGRIGGDEFAVLCTGVTIPNDATRVAERIVAALAVPFEYEGLTLEVGASAGVAFSQPGSNDHSSLLARADRALYQAKSEGRGRWCVG